MKVDLPKNYRPTAKEPYMNPKQLEYFRRKLLAWSEQLQRESEEAMGRMKEESVKAPDIIDQVVLEADRNLVLRTRDRNRKLIYKIDEALQRIKEGTYGYCEETGEEIGIKRLEVRPIATLCIEAQERHEQMEKARKL
jgi:DnaK suppressor protein